MITLQDAVRRYAPQTRKYLTRLGITHWADVTPEALTEFREHLLANIAQNTARELCYQLCNAINKAGVVKIPEGILSLEREFPERPYLTCAEVKRLARLQPQSTTDKKVLYQFLVQCRTGISLSDVMRLTEDNIEQNGSRAYLVYTNNATKNTARCPIGQKTLEQIRYLFQFSESERYKDTYKTHRRIVKMLRSAAISAPTKTDKGTVPKWQVVNHRTARVSFCTNLYMAGVFPHKIGEMIGMYNPEAVQHYISIPANELLTPAARLYLTL